MKSVYFLMSFLISFVSLFSFAEEQNKDFIFNFNKTPLVLQWEASHLRNTDQTSLIFSQDTLELVTNTSFGNDRESVHLGHFNSPLTPQLKILKEEIYQYYIRLKKTVPISSRIQNAQIPVSDDPHTPVLRINDQEINNDHIYFSYLEGILHNQVRNQNWECIDCAIYTLLYKKESRSEIKIQRTIKKEGKTTVKIFSLEDLNCRLKERDSWECVDPESGTLTLSKTEK